MFISLRRPRSAQRQTTTHFATVEVQTEGRRRCGGSFMVEVEYTLDPSYPETRWEPACGGNVDIVAVRPFDWAIDPTTGVKGTRRQYLDCPDWLTAQLRECVDINNLRGDE